MRRSSDRSRWARRCPSLMLAASAVFLLGRLDPPAPRGGGCQGQGVNALGARIARLIERQGPLSIAQFMTLALHDPRAGYYATRDPFGRGGDFITAPEVSQMFGELLGLWIVADLARSGRAHARAAGRARARTRHADGRCVARGARGTGLSFGDRCRADRIEPGAARRATGNIEGRACRHRLVQRTGRRRHRQSRSSCWPTSSSMRCRSANMSRQSAAGANAW